MSAKVFISYSRKDRVFAEQLQNALNAAGHQAFRDVEDIAPAELWKPRLKQLILASDAVVFVLSPDLADSDICQWEARESIRLKKRLMPVVWRPVSNEKLPSEITDRNYIFFTNLQDPNASIETLFKQGLEYLLNAIEVDIDWVREHTRIVGLAERWDASCRPESQLLRNDEISNATAWLEKRKSSCPEIPELLYEFLEAGKKFEKQNRDLMRRVSGRAFVKPAEQAVADGFYDRALRLVAAGVLVAQDPEFEIVPELWGPAAQAISRGRLVRVFHKHTNALSAVSFSQNNEFLLSASYNGLLWIINLSNEQCNLINTHAPIVYARFSEDGSQIITIHRRGMMAMTGNEFVATLGSDLFSQLWNLDNDQQIPIPGITAERHWVSAISFCAQMALVMSLDGWVSIIKVGDGQHLANLDLDLRSVGSSLFSKNGKFIATGLRDYTCDAEKVIRLWNTVTGELITTFDNQGTAEFSADSRFLTVSSLNDSVTVYDLATFEEISSTKVPAGSYSIRGKLSPDGVVLAISASGSTDVILWDHAKQKVIAKLPHNQYDVSPVAFSADGARLATASEDNVVRVWDVVSGELITNLKGHHSQINSLAFCADDRYLASGSSDNSLRVWDTYRSLESNVLKTSGEPSWACFSPNSQYLFIAQKDGNLEAWRTSDWTRTTLQAPSATRIVSLSFLEDDSSVSVLFSNNTIANYRISDPTPYQVMEHELIGSIADISKCGKFIATVSEYGAARVYSFDEGSLMYIIGENEEAEAHKFAESINHSRVLMMEGNEVRGTLFSTDGKLLITMHSDCSIRLWDVESGESVANLRSSGMTTSDFDAVFNDAGNRIVSTRCEVWDLEKYERVAVLEGIQASTPFGIPPSVRSIKFNHAGNRIITPEEGVTVWRSTGERLFDLGIPTHKVDAVAFSHDDCRILTSSHAFAGRIWDSATGHELQCFEEVGSKGGFSNGKFTRLSRDDNWLVSGCSDGTVRIWDISRLSKLGQNKKESLLSALGDGVGVIVPVEQSDLLLEAVPKDLYNSLHTLFNVSPDRIQTEKVQLQLPLAKTCFLSPTQFSKTFGIEQKAEPTE